ncbi:hypothetical protein A2U01_0100299, partial [Trifolium medium]|nr:hypothetical protein [Trifolium medium]
KGGWAWNLMWEGEIPLGAAAEVEELEGSAKTDTGTYRYFFGYFDLYFPPR